MRTAAIVLLLSLPATVSARVDRRSRKHRSLADRLGPRDGYFDAPEHEPDEVLVQIINDPDSSAGQWLTFDGTSFTPFSTSTYHPAATGVILANEAVTSQSKVKVDQIGAGSYEYQGTQPVTESANHGVGILSKQEVDEWLRVHNAARAQHGAGTLQWNEELAKGAKSNAIQCKGEHTYVMLR